MSFVIADRVKETSTSTGTGAVTLAGAVAGHKPFSSRCAVKDHCYYCIQAVDASGVPSGEWETGLGEYSAANTLSRLSVFESSNADALVSFSAGAKQVFITLPAHHFKSSGEVLAQLRNYYVRKDGSDANDGLSNTAGGAFLTITKALDEATLTASGAITINVGAGTYSEYLSFPLPSRDRYVNVVGDIATPSNVVISNIVGAPCAALFGQAGLSGFKLISTSNALRIEGSQGAGDNNLSDLVFGGATESHVSVANQGYAYFSGTMTVSASSVSFLSLDGQSRADLEASSLVMSGTPAFSGAFITAKELSLVKIPSAAVQTVTITGSATGKRYDIRHGSVLLNLQSLTLPGGTDGTTATGGQYTTS